MKRVHFFAVALLIGVMPSAGAVPIFHYVNATGLDDFVIFSSSELSRLDVVPAAAHRYFCSRYDCRYANGTRLLLSKERQSWITGIAIIKNRRLAANRKFHGLGVPIENLQIDLAPRFLWN